MSETTSKIVRWVRGGIYAVMAIVVLGIAIWDLAYASPSMEANDPEREGEEFWPPDMIPHPTLPERAKESDMA